MAFPPRFMDELRARLTLSSLVSRRVRLIKRGREYSGLCPFHNEKSPSFTVSDDKGFFHCFGCGAHGDAIEFVRRSDGLSFPEAVERLAQEVGLPIPETTPGAREEAERHATLQEVVEACAGWFQSQLKGAAGANARRYLETRGLNAETIARFRLGYAPDGRNALKQAMLARNIPEAVLVETGMLIMPGDGDGEADRGPPAGRPSYDRFRDRVMFPITDRRGRVIAFGGRALGDIKPKYLNSPDTPLFHKGRVLYNLALAREAAREAGQLIVAEGYMDVIALAQAGLAHAVAPLGTALTEEQMELLWKLVPEPILCFDGDAAGLRAAVRAAERCLPLLKPGHSFRFALLPAGEDPDSLVKAQGAAAMRDVLAAAVPLAELLWRKETQDRPVDTPERRAALQQSLGDLSRQIGDETVRGYYSRWFRDRLFAEFQKQPGERPYSQRQQRPIRELNINIPVPRQMTLSGRHSKGERLFVLVIAFYPELLEKFHDDFDRLEIADSRLDTMRRQILEEVSRNQSLDSDTLRAQLIASGFGDVIVAGKGWGGPDWPWFLKRQAALADVERWWEDAIKRHRTVVSLEAEVRLAAERFEVEGTQEAQDKLLNLKRLLEANEARPVAVDDFGVASGVKSSLL